MLDVRRGEVAAVELVELGLAGSPHQDHALAGKAIERSADACFGAGADQLVHPPCGERRGCAREHAQHLGIDAGRDDTKRLVELHILTILWLSLLFS
jgi:hypothetical protein